MKKALIVLSVSLLALMPGFAAPRASDLRCEYTVNPDCIDAAMPRLSWIMESGRRADRQTACRILVATSRKGLRSGKADMWDSGKIASGETVGIEYGGKALESTKDYYWTVRIWDSKGKASRWSKPAKWSMGLLSEQDWQGARWIAFRDRETWKSRWDAQKDIEKESASSMDLGGSWPWANWKDSTIFTIWEKTDYDPSPLFRKSFTTDGKVARADLYICGLGYYIPYLNGQRVGDKELNPAMSNFDKRAFYDRYDVTSLIGKDNAVGVMLGRGQYNPTCNDVWGISHSSWIDEPKAIALLRIEYSDGSVENIVTDSTWKTVGGPVVYDDTRHGELYDAREEKDGWDAPGYDDSQWGRASEIDFNTELRAQVMPPVRKFAPLEPVSTSPSLNDSKVFAFEKVMAGWAKVTVKGEEGTKVLVEYCELPTDGPLAAGKDPFYGSFHDRYVCVRQQNGYIMKGEGQETFECMFSYKGFQYVRVSSDRPVEIVSVEAVPVHTDFETVGDFSCSDETVNILQRNSVNGMFGNFEGIPTDCPHREKQGWTCDTYIVSKASMYNFNMAPFYEKWIADLSLSETPQGGYPSVAPSGHDGGNYTTTWPAALVYVPTDMYNFYADTRVLSDNIGNMEALAASSKARELPGKTDIIDDVLGDWISPHPEIDESLPRQNDMAPPEGLPFYGTSAHYLVHRRLAAICAALGLDGKAAYYNARADEIAGRFNDEFYDAQNHDYHGTVPTGYRQSTNATALYYGLVPEEEKDGVTAGLVEHIKAAGNHLGTGFLGIQSLMGFLPEIEPELTYTMVTQPTYPSWGYMVANGATGMWETWDGYDSRNHLPFCCVSEYFYRHLAGIQYDEADPGFRHFFIKPSFIGSLDFVNCHYDSVRGRIESNWRRSGDSIYIDVTVPANTSATVVLPSEVSSVKESGRELKAGNIELGSGRYRFEVKSY